jgi:Uma2 family endonuclease
MSRMSRAPDRIPPGPIKLTYEDYVDLPDDGRRYEILDGELEVSPAPAPRHQAVSRNLFVILHNHVADRRLGSVYYAPIDVILADTSIVQPDIVFIAAGRESIGTERAIEAPPDLVVEIISPWSVRRDRVTKAVLYARFGVRHYWVVDPGPSTLEAHQLEGPDYRLVGAHAGAARFTSALLPDLEIDLGRVWA